MPIINVNGVDIFYEEFGKGSEVIISAQQKFNKGSYCEMLADKGYKVYTITLRGYGKSTHVFEDLGTGWYPTWSSDVRTFAKKMGIEQFIYTGVSHGAGVGWQIVQDDPEVVKAFISIVGAPHDRTGGEESVARRKTISLVQKRESNPEYIPRGSYMVPTNDPKRLARRKEMEKNRIEFLKSATKEELLINPRKPFPHIKTNEELALKLAQIRVPTLFICGCQDDIISPEISLLATKVVKGSKAIFYQDHSHTISGEIPDLIVEDIIIFLKQLEHRTIKFDP